MDHNPYANNVKQTNGCRIWENPLPFAAPNHKCELFIKNLPKDIFEVDILPFFERFGPVFQLRLLIDYDNSNRGFAYLIYFFEKSALECLDLMSYCFIKPGLQLDIERSLKRSHLSALHIPSSLTDAEIQSGLRNLYKELINVTVKRDPRSQICYAIMEFPNHNKALEAKSWSGTGSVNLWNQSVKILWSTKEQVKLVTPESNEVKSVIFHNVPEDLDTEDFGNMMCELIHPNHLLSIRPMKSDCLVEFTDSKAAFTIFTHFNGLVIDNQKLSAEWADRQRLQCIKNLVDLDFELRCFCLGNYCDPPIFIYGRIIPYTHTQLCSVIIKNNRKNVFRTFLVEICTEDLCDIHSRLCEVLYLFLMETKEIPKKDLLFKCTKSFAWLVGYVNDLNTPSITPTTFFVGKPLTFYRDEIYALCRMSFMLIASENLNDIYSEYKMILKDKNANHQFICGLFSDGMVLGCINPAYRCGKPLKFTLDSRHMILALCDFQTLSNSPTYIPALYDLRHEGGGRPKPCKVDKVQLIPLEMIQRREIHFTYRPYIEFNQVDKFSPPKPSDSNNQEQTSFNVSQEFVPMSSSTPESFRTAGQSTRFADSYGLADMLKFPRF